ncbi:MAG TPA: hypothetical protein VL043_07625 [Protaetiibacter sp.]|jgi:hypothetical protein|nr:hypothetical protein [Protaetiibacter sp.]
MSPGLLPGEPRRIIRVFPDYGHDWPLWESATEWRHSPIAMEPSDYGFSGELAALLHTWHHVWEQHFHYDTGWDAPEHERQWTELGDRAVSALRDEVRDWADIEYDGKPY